MREDESHPRCFSWREVVGWMCRGRAVDCVNRETRRVRTSVALPTTGRSRNVDRATSDAAGDFGRQRASGVA